MIQRISIYIEKEFGLFSIAFILFFGDLLFGVIFLDNADGCTGTASTYYATMAVCHLELNFLCYECLPTNLIAFILWVSLKKTRFERIAKALIQLYFFILRPLFIFAISRIQVVPFVPE